MAGLDPAIHVFAPPAQTAASTRIPAITPAGPSAQLVEREVEARGH